MIKMEDLEKLRSLTCLRQAHVKGRDTAWHQAQRRVSGRLWEIVPFTVCAWKYYWHSVRIHAYDVELNKLRTSLGFNVSSDKGKLHD